MKFLLIELIRLYQYAISPLIGLRCRFYLSCSHYILEVIRAHDALRSGYLGTCRLLRCHLRYPGGYDPASECQEQVRVCHRTAKPGE